MPAKGGQAYGLTTRPTAKAYLAMPATADGPMPKLLSETGAFENVRRLAGVRRAYPLHVECVLLVGRCPQAAVDYGAR